LTSLAEGSCARTELLIGRAGIVRLAGAHVLVAGLGGVGGHAAEALGRAGIGTLTLVDHDVVAESNLNRQIVALRSTVGWAKAEVMARRLRDINPELDVRACTEFIQPDNVDRLVGADRLDYVADCIDTVASKTALIAACVNRGIAVVSSMGAGGRLDPTRIHVARLNQTYGCGLARAVRGRLKALGLRPEVMAVFSDEVPRAGAGAARQPSEGSTPRHGGPVTGTISYMPALFGLTLAGVIINRLLAMPAVL
jgi:tRNA A37 threonylcarbamoyladenosine dehydratase